MVWLSLLLACGGGDTDSGDIQVPEEPAAIGRCLYVNPFSDTDECKEYLGDAWTQDRIDEDCASPVPGSDPGVFEAELACDREQILGECIIAPDTEDAANLVFPGGYGDDCSGLSFGCTFAGGEFEPSDYCDPNGGSGGGGVFQPFEQICTDPISGEEPGDGPDGQVCTWQAISGATEEGRHFEDYASCDVVRTQRPYWPASVTTDTASDDPRLSDPDWVAEYDWVTAQVQASACVCCHSEDLAPDGPSGWYLEAGPIWTDSLDDDGMAMMAGWVNSDAFGAFAPENNNGFDRSTAGNPTTDPARMVAYWTGELARRGLSESDFATTPPFGGPLYDQLVYEPDACEGDVGIAGDGTLTWTGGDARYVYVLKPDSSAPGVPPNLDLPDGTLWRIDVAVDSAPVSTGITYGEVPDGASQAFPVDASPAELVAGETYYLYVLADVYQPLERCTFTAEAP